MAKPKQNNEEAVSLFPFLSILACLIGVLTFIITGVAISQMDQSEDLAAVERTEKYGPLIAQIELDQQELAKLDSNYLAEQQLNEQIASARDRLAKVQQRLSVQADRDKVIAQAEAAQQQIKQVNSQIEAVQPELDQLREKIKLDQVELDQRIEDGKPAGTVVRPSGSGIGLKPHFIECTSKHIILHVDGKLREIERGKIAQDQAFIGLLDRVAKQDKERIIFLLRAESVPVFNTAAGVARQRQCRYGKIPVPGEGPLDLTLFNEKNKDKDPKTDKPATKGDAKDKPQGKDEGKDKDDPDFKIFDVPK